jgi:hypothetical protein
MFMLAAGGHTGTTYYKLKYVTIPIVKSTFGNDCTTVTDISKDAL